MRVTEFKQYIKEEYKYPIIYDVLLDDLGEKELEAPNGDTTKIEDILERCKSYKYNSVEEVYSEILANLDEEFIGRKNYDDRSPNYPELDKETEIDSF